MHRPKVNDAPGLQWRGRPGKWVAIWVCSETARKRDYPIKTQRLWPPSADPDASLDARVESILRSECRRLQQEMTLWLKPGDTLEQPKFDGTVRSLIRCYESDPDSPFHNLRYRSRIHYAQLGILIDRNVGARPIAGIKGRDIKRWYENWAQPKSPGGRPRISLAHALITHLRILLTFGAGILEDTECVRVRELLRSLSFANSPRRTEEITREQALAICEQAHREGVPSIALAQALAFELLLRQKDLIGTYLPMEEEGLSGIIVRGKKWLYGLDWRNVSPDLILTHRLSKSLRGRRAILDPKAGKIKRFDLKLYPMVMAEIARIPPERRAGPMIIEERTGLPWGDYNFRIRWRQLADTCGIPKEVQQRDSRAGGITEGLEANGGDLEMGRASAGHNDIKTTGIYARGDDRKTANLARLRAEKARENRRSQTAQTPSNFSNPGE